MTGWYHGIPKTDADLLTDAYEKNEKKYEKADLRTSESKTATPEEFVKDMDWRLYTEWCTERRRGWHDQFSNYVQLEPGVFTDWIARETHYAIEQLLKETSINIDHQFYERVRTEIINAAAKRAIELFSSWQGRISAPKDDVRNLRGSLKEYITTEQRTS